MTAYSAEDLEKINRRSKQLTDLWISFLDKDELTLSVITAISNIILSGKKECLPLLMSVNNIVFEAFKLEYPEKAKEMGIDIFNFCDDDIEKKEEM